MDKIDLILSENPSVWKTRSAFFSWLRGGIRQVWSKHPVKLETIKHKRVRIRKENTKTGDGMVWGGVCECCGGEFQQKDLVVDHIRQDFASLKDVGDIQGFVEKMLIVSKDDLRIVCKGCHRVITHSQRKGVSFDEAKALLEELDSKKSAAMKRSLERAARTSKKNGINDELES